MQTNLALLPHDKCILINDIVQRQHYIQLMQHVLEQLLLALDSFNNNRLAHFDAQVGETLCQVRAYKIYRLKCESSSRFLAHLNEVKQNTLAAKNTLDLEAKRYQYLVTQNKTLRPQSVREPISLHDFFSEMSCLFPMEEDALFLFLSHVLCEFHLVDEEQIPKAIDYEALANKLHLSRSYAKKLGHYYQKFLSELSCKFMFQLAKDLPDNEELTTLLPWLHKQSDEGRMVLPCYTVTDILIRHMIEFEASMVLIVDIQQDNTNERLTVSFEGSKENGRFELLHAFNPLHPCMVMYGGCHASDSTVEQSFLATLLQIGVKEVLLSNNAAHPQYSGATLRPYRDNPFEVLLQDHRETFSSFEACIAKRLSDELMLKKSLAHTLGCTAENQRFFLLKHIFCDTLDAYQAVARPQEKIPLEPLNACEVLKQSA